MKEEYKPLTKDNAITEYAYQETYWETDVLSAREGLKRALHIEMLNSRIFNKKGFNGYGKETANNFDDIINYWFNIGAGEKK